MKTRLIGKYDQEYLASIHQGLLKDNNVDAYIFGSHFMGVFPNFSGLLGAGIELRVKEEDFEKAREILIAQETHKIKCANCDSENIEFSYGKKGFLEILISVFSAAIGEPFGNINRHYFCKDCGFKNKD